MITCSSLIPRVNDLKAFFLITVFQSWAQTVQPVNSGIPQRLFLRSWNHFTLFYTINCWSLYSAHPPLSPFSSPFTSEQVHILPAHMHISWSVLRPPYPREKHKEGEGVMAGLPEEVYVNMCAAVRGCPTLSLSLFLQEPGLLFLSCHDFSDIV